MSTSIDLTPASRARVSRSAAPAATLSASDKASGLRSVAEVAVMKAVKDARLSTTAAVARAAGLPEPAAARAIRSLEDRDVIRRSMDGLGRESFAARR